VPQSWGVADHSVANLQPLCRTCNLLKSDTEDLDYRTDGADEA
jgi:5-methylcytosine-specific restriction endonuclease McrA